MCRRLRLTGRQSAGDREAAGIAGEERASNGAMRRGEQTNERPGGLTVAARERAGGIASERGDEAASAQLPQVQLLLDRLLAMVHRGIDDAAHCGRRGRGPSRRSSRRPRWRRQHACAGVAPHAPVNTPPMMAQSEVRKEKKERRRSWNRTCRRQQGRGGRWVLLPQLPHYCEAPRTSPQPGLYLSQPTAASGTPRALSRPPYCTLMGDRS